MRGSRPYVLRSWEAEFPDLGVAKTEGGPRVYRRADVERVLRLKHLLFVEGLTLAGARRKMPKSSRRRRPTSRSAALGELLGDEARQRIRSVGQMLRELAAMLSRRPGEPPSEDEFQLRGRCADRRVACEGRGEEGGPQEEVSPARFRDVAQPGSAPDWGSGGRWFESSHPDQFHQ